MRVDPLDLLFGQLLHRQHAGLVMIAIRRMERGCQRVVGNFVRGMLVRVTVDGEELLYTEVCFICEAGLPGRGKASVNAVNPLCK